MDTFHNNHTRDLGSLSVEEKDKLIRYLHIVIRYSVRFLAVLMVFVIVWGVLDVVWILYKRLLQPPVLLLSIGDILATFGGFLAVLIAIEIFINITVYLRDEVIHVKLVISTALMAIARKVIVFDYKMLEPEYIWATGAVLLSLGITYWLIDRKVGD